MFEKIPPGNRKRFYQIVLIVLPLCFGISFFLSTKIFILLNFKFDLKGWVFLSICLVFLYLIGVLAVQRKLSGK